jgi:ABC-2 type transport system permease protein
MILHIAKKEILELVRDGRMQWLGALMALLLIAAFSLGWVEQKRVGSERSEALQEERENWLEQGDKNPHGASHDGMHVFKPLSSLAFFDPGVDGYLGTSVKLESHRQNHIEHPPAADFGGLQRFGAITPAFLLQSMAPLLLILAAFAAFAGEREQGTLRQALSCGASPMALLWGKFLAVVTVVGGVLLLALVGSAWMVSAQESSSGSGAEMGRLVALAVGYALYCAGFVALTLAVSAKVRATRSALVIMLGFWALTIFVAPRLMPHIARSAVSLPSLQEFDEALHADLATVPDGHNSQDTFIQERIAKLLRQHNVTDPAKLPFNIHGLIMQEGEERSIPIIDRHFGSLWDRIEKQTRVRLAFGLVAPSLAIESFSMTLAGTDFAHHRDFAAAAEKQRRILIKTLNDDMMNNSKFGDHSYVATRKVWERVPEFQYSTPGVGWALKQTVMPTLLLVIWAGGTSVLAFFAVRRLQPL